VNDVDLRQGIPLGGGGVGSVPAPQSNEKLCPFRFQHIVDPNSLARGQLATFGVEAPCAKEVCAWWTDNGCAVAVLAKEKSHA